MKTMKRLQVLLVVAMLVATMSMAVGCNKVEEFKYSDVKVTSNVQEMVTTLEPTLKSAYSIYTLGVSKKEFILKTPSTESRMSYKKDGDKYVCQGDEAEELKNSMNAAFASQGVTVNKIEVYGEKTDKGWAIVIEESLAAGSQQINVEMRIIFENE